MTKKDLPLVSVVIPVYNGSNYVAEAIDSVLAQTYPNVEIIVVNDGSTDGGETEKIVLSYGDKVRYFHKENGGVSTAVNFGIRQMCGEYFSWLSHDDLFTPEKIAHQMAVASPDKLVLCGRHLVDANRNILPDARDTLRFRENGELNWQEAFVELMRQGGYNGCALLIPKAAFDRCGGFDTQQKYCQDLMMWMRLFLSGYGLSVITEKDVLSRVHGAQQTGRADHRFHADCIRMGQLMLDEIAEKSTRQNNLLFAFAAYHAVYHTPTVVRQSRHLARQHRLFSFGDYLRLGWLQLYGAVRPVIRNLYYRIAR